MATSRLTNRLSVLRDQSGPLELNVADQVWRRRAFFIRWPCRPYLFWPGCVRNDYHTYSPHQIALLRQHGIRPDGRSNGPAVMSYLLVDGERPHRQNEARMWSIHHIYDGKFPFPGRDVSAHAVRHGKLFTEAAGLVAIHPIADALADEVPYFAWLLRLEAFKRFGLDPDVVFS